MHFTEDYILPHCTRRPTFTPAVAWWTTRAPEFSLIHPRCFPITFHLTLISFHEYVFFYLFAKMPHQLFTWNRNTSWCLRQLTWPSSFVIFLIIMNLTIFFSLFDVYVSIYYNHYFWWSDAPLLVSGHPSCWCVASNKVPAVSATLLAHWDRAELISCTCCCKSESSCFSQERCENGT